MKMKTLHPPHRALRTLGLILACGLALQAIAAESPAADAPVPEDRSAAAAAQGMPPAQATPAAAVGDATLAVEPATATLDTATAETALAEISPVEAATDAASASGEGSYDPWQKFNRRMHRFNMVLDRHVARPVARGYVKAVPAPVRRSVGNFFNNVGQSTTMVNALLQGKPKRAGQSLSRLVINSTVGLGGLFDPATKVHIPNTNEDFGQTLATWGWKKSRYLELPLLGPTTVRDTVANGLDSALTSGKGALSPLRNVSANARLALDGLALVEGRSQLLQYDSLRESAPDDYLLLREFWLQHRQYEILDQGGEETVAALPDYLQQETAQPLLPESQIDTRVDAK
ncbi:MAG: VacJ family lipoprotein [Lysobacteraceae bacterium]